MLLEVSVLEFYVISMKLVSTDNHQYIVYGTVMFQPAYLR